MTLKYTKILHSKALQNLPNLRFFSYENMPSGNSGAQYQYEEVPVSAPLSLAKCLTMLPMAVRCNY
jgi:hypothetical protein